MNTSWKGSAKRNVDRETERKSWKVYADELLRGIKDRIFRNILLLSSMCACRGSRQGGSVASTNAIVTAGCKGARKFMVDRSANQPPNRQPNRQSSKKFHCRRIGITGLVNRCFSVIMIPRLRFRAGFARDFLERETRRRTTALFFHENSIMCENRYSNLIES